jgi:hypothetical protein
MKDEQIKIQIEQLVAAVKDSGHGEIEMTTLSEIKPAIRRSITRNEIVLLIVDDPKDALAKIDNDEGISDFGWGTENNGDLDVWGTRHGDDFRIRIRAGCAVAGGRSQERPDASHPSTCRCDDCMPF